MSSKRRLRRKACKRKVRHETEANARIALSKTTRHTAGEMLVTYACRWCGGWHVGHPPKRIQQAMLRSKEL